MRIMPNKPVAKTPDDVMKALASEITKHVILATRDCVMIGSYTASKEFAESLMPDVKRFYNEHIQPLIDQKVREEREQILGDIKMHTVSTRADNKFGDGWLKIHLRYHELNWHFIHSKQYPDLQAFKDGE